MIHRTVIEMFVRGAVFITALLVLYFAVTGKVWANHEETGLAQAKTPCLVNKLGEPTANPKDGIATMVCYIVVMPGYPEQSWVFVENPAKGMEVEAVFLMGKDLKVIKKLWPLGKAI